MQSLAALSEAFGDTANPQYFIPFHTHNAALRLLSLPPGETRNIRVIIGEPGMGKTILLLRLLEEFRSSALTVHLFWTQLGHGEFLCYFLRQLGVVHPARDVRQAQEQLSAVLEREFHQARKVIVAVDEAHDLDIEALCELAEVLDCNSTRNKDLQVVLAGLPILKDKIAVPQLQKLWERVSEISVLSPLTNEETASYIHRRLQISGYRDAIPFAPDAITALATLAEGVPRNINNLCRSCLFLATERSRTTIDSSIVHSARASCDIAPRLEEMLSWPRPAFLLPRIDQAKPASAEPPMSRAYAQNAVPVADNPTSVPQEPAGESGNNAPTAHCIRQWFGNTRLAWSGTIAELAAAVEAPETDLAHALQQDCEELRGFGIAVSFREPVGCLRQITLRSLRLLEQTCATEVKSESPQVSGTIPLRPYP
ncbi:MAG: AAA family ATPase [Acidobacteria bacterium]|nr:AAA family ATPase [Acidobacteriota bacterium]